MVTCASLRKARALQDVLLQEVARAVDVLGREVAEKSLPSGWLHLVGNFQRNEEDEAVLAALQQLREAMLQELIASIEVC